jgi:DNA-binding transcriptional regulator YiaG
MSSKCPDPGKPKPQKNNRTKKMKSIHKEVEEVAASTTSVNPGGPNTPKFNAKPRNRKPSNQMTPDEFKALQSAAGLTNAAAATALGVSVRAIETWRQGTRRISQPVAELARLKFRQ